MEPFGSTSRNSPVSDLGSFELNWIRDQVKELALYSQNDFEQRFAEDWYFYYKHFKNYVDRRTSTDDYKSNIGVGLAYPIVEIVFAKLMEPWITGDELIRALAEEDVGEPRAPKIGALVNNILMERTPRSFAKHGLMKKSALIVGRGVMKPHIQYLRPRTLLRRIPQIIQNVRIGSYADWTDVPAMKRINFEYVDPFDWWMTPGAMFLDDADWTFERSYDTTSTVRGRQESGEWEMLKDEIVDSDAIGFDEWRMKRLNLSGYNDHVKSSATREMKQHRVLEFQGRLGVKKKSTDREKYRDVRVVMLNENQICVYEPLKSWNGKPEYLLWQPQPDPMSERAIGMIEPIEDLLLELNDYENIALDNARKALETPLLVDPNATQQDKIYLGPAEINWVKNPTASVAPMPMRDLPSSFYHQIGFLNDLIQRVSGVSDYFGGMNTADTSKLSKTATGMQLMANLSASRFGPLMGSLDREYYRLAAQWVHETSKLWLNQSMGMRLPANPSSPFTSIAPDDLDAQMNFHFNTKAMDPKSEQKRENFIRMVELLSGMAPMLQQTGHYIDFYEVAKMLTDEFDRGGDVSKLVKSVEQNPMAYAQPGMDPMQGLLGGIPGDPNAMMQQSPQGGQPQ